MPQVRLRDHADLREGRGVADRSEVSADERGETMPHTLLGRAVYLEHHGGRPMQVQWELESPMPAGMVQETKVAAG